MPPQTQMEANEQQGFQVSKHFRFPLLSMDLLTLLLPVAFAFSSGALRTHGITSLGAKSM